MLDTLHILQHFLVHHHDLWPITIDPKYLLVCTWSFLCSCWERLKAKGTPTTFLHNNMQNNFSIFVFSLYKTRDSSNNLMFTALRVLLPR